MARVYSVPGIGILTATALYAFVGDPLRFPSGRHLASFIGLTPREYSSGSRRHLGRISKRGDAYLRMLLVHGARAILWHAKRLKRPDRLRAWALRLEKKTGHNKADKRLPQRGRGYVCSPSLSPSLKTKAPQQTTTERYELNGLLSS